MRQKRVKQLRRILLKKPNEVLVMIREEYGQMTQQIETPQALWRTFKKMYKNGKIPQNFLIEKGEEV
jgi:hypothetical protein